MIFTKKPNLFTPDFEVCGTFISHQDKVLFLKRDLSKPHGGKYGIPGWKRDIWESIAECARRETLEETGLSILPKKITSVYVDRMWERFQYHMFSAYISDTINIILNPTEHSEYIWIRLEDSENIDLIPWMKESIQYYLEIKA